MGIRIQPKEIEVPEDNPFKHDLLGREKPVEILTHLIGSVEGPCVLAIDAAWGTGKTTFIRMWSQYLRNENFPVIEFNAWENDFAGDPFVALSAELTDGFREYVDESLAEKMQNVASEVLQWIVPGAIRGITASTLLGGLGESFASYTEERLSKYQKTKDSVKAFKKSLKEIACELMKPRDGQPGRPLVVIIDELDRCRPSYAVELLEVAKHLFAVDNIIFVLAVNRSQLARSIRALYGSDFDAEGYLRRFFDLDFQLLDPGQQVLTNERHKFIDALLKETHIDQYFNTQKIFQYARTLLWIFFGTPSVSLRRAEQAIHRLGLVFASLPRDQQTLDSGRWSWLMLAAVIALIMRTLDFDRYGEFIRGELSDEHMIKLVYSWPGAEALRQQHASLRLFHSSDINITHEEAEALHQQHASLRPSVEAIIIIAYQEITNSSFRFQEYYDPDPVNLQTSNALHGWEMQHKEKLRKLINHLWNMQNGIGFRDIVLRLELLSPDFLNEGPDDSSSA